MMNNFEVYQDKFVERLKDLMIDSGAKSILAFSRIINIQVRTLNYWINKKSTPHMEAIIKIATHFDIPADYLLGIIDS